MIDLKNKTILITGASSGIGRQCAITCSQTGARIILLGRNQERLQETLSLLDEQNNHLKYALDLTDYSKVDEVTKELNNQDIKIDGLINSAGISTTLPLKIISPEKINSYYNVNVTSAVNLTRLLTQKKYFNSNGGSIIFISSVMGIVGEAGKTIYSLTKGALVSGVKSMALELAKRNIRVNSISPGVVETPMSESAVYSQSEEALEKIKSLHPLGLGKPEDVANTAAFLLSVASRWITGTNIIVDGGYTAR